MTVTWELVTPGAFAGMPDQLLALGSASKRTCCVMRYLKSIGELFHHCINEGCPPRLRSCGPLDTLAHRVPI